MLNKTILANRLDVDAHTRQKLAASLTAEQVDLIPYLPYLLQDLNALGTSPQVLISLINAFIPEPAKRKFLDLGCGKGAVSLAVAERFKASVTGIDIMPAFIESAAMEAEKRNLSKQCIFKTDDINNSVKLEVNYDCVILGAVGDILGEPEETLSKLSATVKDGGFIIIDDAYLREDGIPVKYVKHDYLTKGQWQELFEQLGITVLAECNFDDSEIDKQNRADVLKIEIRAQELSDSFPDKRELFEGYVVSQHKECDDLCDAVVGVVWLLQKA
jgi:Predicted O-methyltransferase